MERIETDVVIVGAGTAGLNARREVERAGKRWILVEDGPYGTTCARVGCMPSKLLIAAADAAHEARHAGLFGVDAGDVRVDGARVMARVRAERDRFAGFVVAATEKLPEDRRLHGRARWVAPSIVEVGDRFRVEARAAVIATGSSPNRLPLLDALGPLVSTSDGIFELPTLPRRLLVIGAGVIGLELGQAFQRLGVETVIADRGGGLAGISDPAVQVKALAVLGKELDLRLRQVITGAERLGSDSARVSFADGTTVEVDRVLLAAGRSPNVRGIGLETLGLELDERGVPKHDRGTLQCGELPLFVAGDAADDVPLLHEAADDGSIAGKNAASFPEEITPRARRTPLSIAFLQPNVASVGMRFAELDPKSCAIGEASYDDQGRARVMGQNAGLLRVYGDPKTRRLLGAELIAPRGEHLAHLLAWAIASELTVDRALELPFYHPVVEEGVRTALQSLSRALHCPDGDCTSRSTAPAS